MNKFLGGGFWLPVGVFIVGVLVGVNWSKSEYDYRNIWPEDRGALNTLNERMNNDNSMRLAIAVITEKNQYQISSISNTSLYCELRKVDQ